jgi:hypothetical protein
MSLFMILLPVMYWLGILFMSRLAANQQFNKRAKAYFRTERPRNYCEDCEHHWFPRNRDRSLKCGQCGSANTRIFAFPWDEWYELSMNVGKVFAFFFFPGLAVLVVVLLFAMGMPGPLEIAIVAAGAIAAGWPPYWLHKRFVRKKRMRYQPYWAPQSS